MKATNGAEVSGSKLENLSVDQSLVSVNDVQHDWNSWSSVENASDVNPGSHDILLADDTAESHAKPAPSLLLTNPKLQVQSLRRRGFS